MPLLFLTLSSLGARWTPIARLEHSSEQLGYVKDLVLAEPIWPSAAQVLFRSGGFVAGSRRNCCLGVDSVEQVGFEWPRQRSSAVAVALTRGVSPHVAGIGAGAGISLASFRRFWAVAARWNSSRAPFGPRNRSRSSLRMRLRCANSISTFLRW